MIQGNCKLVLVDLGVDPTCTPRRVPADRTPPTCRRRSAPRSERGRREHLLRGAAADRRRRGARRLARPSVVVADDSTPSPRCSPRPGGPDRPGPARRLLIFQPDAARGSTPNCHLLRGGAGRGQRRRADRTDGVRGLFAAVGAPEQPEHVASAGVPDALPEPAARRARALADVLSNTYPPLLLPSTSARPSSVFFPA